MMVSDRFYPFGGVPVFDAGFLSFSLNYVVNTGAAWGIFQGYPALLFSVRALIILALFAYLLFFQKEKRGRIALWLIGIGALGNAIDFALYGHVIDLFHFTFWGKSFPVFNFADSYITLGVFALLIFNRKQTLKDETQYINTTK